MNFNWSQGLSFDALASLGTQILVPFIIILAIAILRSKSLNSGSGQNKSALLLLILSGLGGIITLMSHNWMLVFLGIQCMSIAIYALINGDGASNMLVSAALKYLFLSAFAMALMLMGILLLYAATGSMDFNQQALKLISINPEQKKLFFLGAILVLTGLAFKLSLFPWHLWAPSVYQAAPWWLVSLLAIMAKSVIVIFALRLWLVLLADQSSLLTHIIGIMAIISMWLSGLMLIENNLMRIIAWLSISHLGFLIIAILNPSSAAISAIFIDLAVFGLGLVILLAALSLAQWGTKLLVTVDDLAGLAKSQPMLSLIIAVALISLAGFPLTAGFVGKFSVFRAVIGGEQWWFVPHMLISSVLSIIALARILITIFKPELSVAAQAPGYQAIKQSSFSSACLWLGVICLLVFGVFPETVLSYVDSQVLNLSGL